MSKFQCYPISDPNGQWNYCPSYGAAVLFCVLYGLTLTAHVVQACLYKRLFALVIAMGAAWEFTGYISRVLSIEWQENQGFANAQLLLIILAPLWINAFVYMVLGRMIHFYLPEDSVYNVKARRITQMFVCFDILSFLIQATGGSMMSSGNAPNVIQDGLHVYMGGVGLQLLFIAAFVSLAVRLQQKIGLLGKSGHFRHDTSAPRLARRLLYAVYAVLGLIIFRNIYRLVEFSSGTESSITQHEWYSYVFDAVPMLIALIIFNACHPGRILVGPNSDFSEQRRERKEAKKAAKREKTIAKDSDKRVKLQAKLEKKQEKETAKQMKKGNFLDVQMV